VNTKGGAGGDSYEPSFEPSGRNGGEDRTPNSWVKGAKQNILELERLAQFQGYI